MKLERFNELLRGPLSHPMPLFHISRLARALQFIVDHDNPKADKDLEIFCELQQQQDDLQDIPY